jgi:ribosomal-protein-serine acetyltransferase
MSTDKMAPDGLELMDARLRLRPWRDGDAMALFEAARESVASVGRWLPWCHADYAMEDAAGWIAHCRSGLQSGEYFAFPIFDAASGMLLGGVGLNQLGRLHRSANLGYWVRLSSQRQGVAVAAAKLLAQFGFGQLGLIRIEIVMSPDNLPSRRTAEMTGAKFETIARHRLWMREQAQDAAVYALIPQDLR